MTPTPRPLIAGNWKMNSLRREALDHARELAARAMAEDLPPCDIVICPPATLLVELRAALDGSPIQLGAQDCHTDERGARTGDISAAMLADAGCRFVIVGHSERRAGYGETDGIVRAKAEAARRAGLVAIICLGESEAEREAEETLSAVSRQLEASLPPGSNARDTVIAYEPVWAVGSGRTPSEAQLAEVHGHLHQRCQSLFSDGANGVRVLYGGSVDPDNAAGLLGVAGVGGALVGGASLSVDDFWAICRATG